MRKYVFPLFLISVVLLFISCKEKIVDFPTPPPPAPPVVECRIADKADVYLGASGVSEKPVSIRSDTEWSLRVQDPAGHPWLQLKTAGGVPAMSVRGTDNGTVSVLATPLSAFSLRKAVVELVCAGNVVERLNVIQADSEESAYLRFTGFLTDNPVSHADFVVDGKLHRDVPVCDGLVGRTSFGGTRLTSAVFYARIGYENVVSDWFDFTDGVELPDDGTLDNPAVIPIPDFAGGDGSRETPYTIANARQLRAVGKFGSGDVTPRYYKLIADIDLADACTRDNAPFYNQGDGWIPIHIYGSTFDGNHKTVGGLTITSYYGSYHYAREVGLFGWIWNSTIRNLYMTDVRIDVRGGVYYGGAIGGIPDKSLFENCHVSNVSITVTDVQASAMGGLAGFSGTDRFFNCSVSGENLISAGPKQSSVGGICGKADGEISNCFVEAVLECGSCSGIAATGIPAVSQCYADVSVSYPAGDFFVTGISQDVGWQPVSANCSILRITTAPKSRATYCGIGPVSREPNVLPENNLLVALPIIGNNYTEYENQIYTSYHGQLIPEEDLALRTTFEQPPLNWDFDTLWEMSPDGKHPVLKNQLVK